MQGVEIKKILQENGFVLAKVALTMGESPQNLANLLNAADVKSGTIERLCRAINETIYFFYSNKKYSDIAPRPEFSTNDVVSLEKYAALIRENERLRLELEAVKQAASARLDGDGGGYALIYYFPKHRPHLII